VGNQFPVDFVCQAILEFKILESNEIYNAISLLFDTISFGNPEAMNIKMNDNISYEKSKNFKLFYSTQNNDNYLRNLDQ